MPYLARKPGRIFGDTTRRRCVAPTCLRIVSLSASKTAGGDAERHRKDALKGGPLNYGFLRRDGAGRDNHAGKSLEDQRA